MSARPGLVGQKQFPASFGAISGNFFHGPTKPKNVDFWPVFLGGPMGPIHPVWGHLVIFVWAGSNVLSDVSAKQFGVECWNH